MFIGNRALSLSVAGVEFSRILFSISQYSFMQQPHYWIMNSQSATTFMWQFYGVTVVMGVFTPYRVYPIEYFPVHYCDVTMGGMASQITSLTIVYSSVYSRRRSKKTSKLRITGLCAWNSPVTGEFFAQRASNAENVSIWRRHFVVRCFRVVIKYVYTCLWIRWIRFTWCIYQYSLR